MKVTTNKPKRSIINIELKKNGTMKPINEADAHDIAYIVYVTV